MSLGALAMLESSRLETHSLGDLALQSGGVLCDARLTYRTVGKLDENRGNAVLFPTYFTGTDADNAKLVAPGRALDPTRYFVVIPNLFGNGVSSSPSNHPTQGRARFPRISLYDNARGHERLLREVFGIDRVLLACGWSMGAQQAYHFAALFPERVRRLLVVCGSAKTSVHNRVFLEGVKAALQADTEFMAGCYEQPPRRGLDAFGRVYAGWAYSHAFFRKGAYRQLGYPSVDRLLDAWGREHMSYDANDLLCMLRSWQHADISDNGLYGGDLRRALGAIQAKTIIMPCASDLYFHADDSREEARHVPRAELRVIESDWGHIAGGPDRNPDDAALVDQALRELLGT